MTQYINADALKIQIACVYGSNPKYLRWLNDAPTVDAIPIEWIEEWCISQDLTYIKIAVEKLLDDWRKEHDKTD